MNQLIFNRILVPVVLSDAGGVLEKARAIAIDAEIRLLHVLPPVDSLAGNVVAMASQIKAERERSLEALRTLAKSKTNILCDVRVGQAADEINCVAAEWEADLIVMPARRHGALHHALLGSVTERVLRSADCPVLVLPVSK